MSEDTSIVRVNFSALFSLETIGIITGIILCILQGVGVIDIGWFWATFPFWIPIALDIAVFLLICLVVIILVGLDS